MTDRMPAGPLTQEERDALKVLRMLTLVAGEHLPLPALFAKKPPGRTAQSLLKGLDGLVSKGLAIANHDRFTFALTVAGEVYRPAGGGGAMTEVTRDQFDVNALQAMHRPTGAKINWATIEEPDFHFATRGKIGEVLENGEVYSENDVWIMGVRLLMELFAKRREGD